MRWTLLVGALAAMLAVSVIGGVGCFSPRVADCAQACGPNNSCASGLACEESTQLCRVPANMGTACPGIVDGAIDAIEVDAPIVVDVAVENCTWALVSTNFSPADVDDPDPPVWNITADTTFTTGGADGHAVAQAAGDPLWIVHKKKLTVAAGATLTIKGPHALIIAADEIDVQGNIVAENGMPPATCDAQVGADVCDKATGGGGGGYGGVGGDGGGAAGAGGMKLDVLPTPLRPGCPGAKGGDGRKAGDTTPRLGGAGGAGGGAIQLSGRLSVNIAGEIRANGFKGLQGTSDQAGGGACGLTGRASGGGGGGGGGTIFIQSCETVVAPTAKLCANGGGGGGGAGGGNSNTGQPGQDGRCGSAAPGGAGEIANSYGGTGGYAGNFNGGAGAIASRGGGGGGGAVGRIHIYQVSGPAVITGATIEPPHNRPQ